MGANNGSKNYLKKTNATSGCIAFFIFKKKRFIAQAVYTVCARINYKNVPVTSLNKYLHCGTSGTE